MESLKQKSNGPNFCELQNKEEYMWPSMNNRQKNQTLVKRGLRKLRTDGADRTIIASSLLITLQYTVLLSSTTRDRQTDGLID